MECCNNQRGIYPARPQIRPQMTPPPMMNPGGGCSGAVGVVPPVPPVQTNVQGGAQQMMPGESLDRYPIAMAYVPWQRWNQTYPLEQGFRRGTIFPELDLKFLMGRCQ